MVYIMGCLPPLLTGDSDFAQHLHRGERSTNRSATTGVIGKHQGPHTRWCPSSLAKLVYNSNNYGLWWIYHDISILTMVYKPNYKP